VEGAADCQEWIVSPAFFPRSANVKKFVLGGGLTAGYAALNEAFKSRSFPEGRGFKRLAAILSVRTLSPPETGSAR
jgi:hypothetical protein